eukprot:gene11709-70_t
MDTFWKVVQTTVTFGVVGYAAYLWYDIWREEQREAQLQEEEEAEAAAAQAAEKEKAQASSSQLADGNQSKKSSENTTKGSTKNTGKQNSRGFCGFHEKETAIAVKDWRAVAFRTLTGWAKQ